MPSKRLLIASVFTTSVAVALWGTSNFADKKKSCNLNNTGIANPRIANHTPNQAGTKAPSILFQGDAWIVGGLSAQPFELALLPTPADETIELSDLPVGLWCSAWKEPLEDDLFFLRSHVLVVEPHTVHGWFADSFRDLEAGVLEFSANWTLDDSSLCWTGTNHELEAPQQDDELLQWLGEDNWSLKLRADADGGASPVDGNTRCWPTRAVKGDEGFAVQRAGGWARYRRCTPNSP